MRRPLSQIAFSFAFIVSLTSCDRQGMWPPSTLDKEENAGREAYRQGRYVEAERHWASALKEADREGAPEFQSLFEDLAELYLLEGKNAEAESLYKRAVELVQKAGSDTDVLNKLSSEALNLNGLGDVYLKQGKYLEAEPLYKRALELEAKAYGPNEGTVSIYRDDLLTLYEKQERYAHVEKMLTDELHNASQEKLVPYHEPSGRFPSPSEMRLSSSLTDLADFYRRRGRYDDAEPLYVRALSIQEKALGPDHPAASETRKDYAALLSKIKRDTDAAKPAARAKVTRSESK